MIKGEDDFEFIWEHFYNDIAKGNQTKCKALIVFMFDGDKTAGYKAWETDASIIFENLNGVDSKINFNINFGGQIRTGTAKPGPDGAPTFEVKE